MGVTTDIDAGNSVFGEQATRQGVTLAEGFSRNVFDNVKTKRRICSSVLWL